MAFLNPMAAGATLLAALLASASAIASEDDEAALETRVKAAFVSKFASYVEWPAHAFRDSQSPIVIGVAGADPLADELEQAVAGRVIGDRVMQVRRLGLLESIGSCCQIIFVGRSLERARAAEMLSTVRGKPILIVTDAERMAPQGSIINFLAADGRVRFDIARDAADRSGLRLSSQLLAVARQVKGGSP